MFDDWESYKIEATMESRSATGSSGSGIVPVFEMVEETGLEATVGVLLLYIADVVRVDAISPQESAQSEAAGAVKGTAGLQHMRHQVGQVLLPEGAEDLLEEYKRSIFVAVAIKE
eukprot:scaffold4925_cov125-Isochrysis_galbana.AAC.6